MATQLVQYMDLRLAIDNNPQPYGQPVTYQGVSDTQSEAGRQFDLESEDGPSRQSSKQESRPSTKGRTPGAKKPNSKSGSRDGKASKASTAASSVASDDLEADLVLEDLETGEGKDFADVGMQDEGGDASAAVVEEGRRHSRRSRSTLAPVEEFEDYDDVYDLADEQAWSSVPKDQLEGRFSQYRRICQHKLRESEEQRQLTVAKTQRKVQLLKSQFVEHKTKWETERKVLISQVEQAQQLQTDAEKEADQAMTQLEDFIAEQERLEEEEETRRSAILRGASGASLSPAPLTPAPRTPLPPATPGALAASPAAASAQPTPPESRNTQASEELHSLLQQTDDAKAEELRGRVAGTNSAPPGVDMTTVPAGTAPGLTTPEAAPSGPETADTENRDAATQESSPQVALEDLQDLPPIEGTTDDSASTPSIQPPPTAATIGSLPAHDQLETPLADIPDESIAESTKGEKSELQEDTPDAMIKIDGNTEEELREVSARSRASLRSQYKNRLEESRQAAEDRRAKSPHITLPANLSVDDELVIDDDDDDEEFDQDLALPDDEKEEQQRLREKEMWRDDGTSPPPGKIPAALHMLAAGKWSKLLDHPILEEYLKTYHCVTTFKDNISKLFLDKDMMSASQIISDLETLVFETDKKVMPQVEQFTSNIIFILEEISSVINNAVMVDREPPVSSLLPFSRDDTRSRLPHTPQASAEQYAAYHHPKQFTPTSTTAPTHGRRDSDDTPAPQTHMGADPAVATDTVMAGRESSGGVEGQGSQEGSRKSSVSGASTKQQLADLHNQCSMLQVQLEEDNKKHEEQLSHNTVVMMDMQDTINALQRELSAIGRATKKPRSASSAHALTKTPSPDQSLMFTRLDLERNAKIMKKAVMDQRLDADKYKEAVTTMDDYVSLPAQRLGHLVKKYVHHSRMKEIEENVKNSESLDERVFDTLDKMEDLQNQRARQWAEKMDVMGVERLRLAAMLMDSLDTIEQESGLFLIKPMYSYRGRELKAPPTQKLARPVRTQPVPRHQSAARESTTSFVPAPTPASNTRRMDRHTPSHQVSEAPVLPPPPPSRPEDGVVGSGAIRNIVTPQSTPLMQPYHTWNMSVSQTRSPLDIVQHSLNTPRMLELDINRMLIGQNNVSTKLPYPPTEDRLVNASNNSLRSYVTVQRPAATLAGERPTSAGGGRDTAPPSSPSPRPPVGVSPTDRDLPDTMTSPPPLPPIGDRAGSASSSQADDPEPPRSPPGSSMYQSTNHELDEGHAHKTNTRPSSQLSQLSLSDAEQH